jgi:hypothetical protein
MSVRNNGSHDIQLDVVARGFPDDNTAVMTNPGSIASGLTKKVSISFTVSEEIFDVLAYIDLFLVPVSLCKEPVLLSCPIFYRVCRSATQV